jgi:hypothetical protein
MALFSYCTNAWAHAYRAFSNKPKIMWAYTLGYGAAGATGGLAISGIIYAAYTSPPSCDWGNYIVDHAKEFGCVVTGDPCPQDGTGMVDVKPVLQDTKPALQSEPDLKITCNESANVGKLKQAASDYISQESSQNEKGFWGSVAEFFFIAMPIVGFLAGSYVGYRLGLKKAEAQMTEDLFEPFLTETHRQEAASPQSPEPGSPTSVMDAQAKELETGDSQTLQMQPFSPTSRHTSGFHSPTNPRNSPRQAQTGVAPFEIEVRSMSLSPRGNTDAA